ncbi:hypothetical protein ACHAW6_001559 [Cyclotella cf. meneghiniana]
MILMAGRSPICLQHVPAQIPATAARPDRHRSFHHPQLRRRHARLHMGNDPLRDQPPPPCRRPLPTRPFCPTALVCRQLCPRELLQEGCTALPTPLQTWSRCGLLSLPCKKLRDLPPCLRTCSQSCLRCRKPASPV